MGTNSAKVLEYLQRFPFVQRQKHCKYRIKPSYQVEEEGYTESSALKSFPALIMQNVFQQHK